MGILTGCTHIASSIAHVAAAPTPLFTNTNLNQDIPIPLGIFIGLLASFVQSLGLAIQRRSHVHNSQLQEQDQKVEHRRPLWLIGFAIFLISNVFGSFIQIASLPVVILAPLGAVSLLWNALFANLLLRPRMLLGTALIAGGAALIAIYGIVPETTRSLDELMALFARPAFIGWFCAEGFILLVCLIVTHGIEYSYKRQLEAAAYSLLQANHDSPLSSSCTSAHDSPTPLPPTRIQQSNLYIGPTEEQVNGSLASEITPLLDPKPGRLPSTKSTPHNPKSSSPLRVPLPGRTPLLLALAYAAASGTLSGLCLIFAKSGVELLVLTFRGVNQFFRWEAWILVGGLIIFALGQLWYLNRGLRLADPAFVCPSAFCFYNFSSIINGLVYFDQLGQLPGWHLILVIVGMFVLLAGVWAVSAQANVDECDTATESDVEDQSELNSRSATPETNPSPHYPSYASTAVGPQGSSLSGSIAPPMDRRVRSEGAVFPQSPVSLHTLSASSSQLSPPFTAHQTGISPPLPGTSRSSRQHPTIIDPSASMRTMSSSLHQQQSSSVLSPTGLTIGLSPVSPGFGLLPSTRTSRRISGGLGFAVVVNETMSLADTAGGRRWTVSEGRGRHSEEARDGGVLSDPRSELLQQDVEEGDSTAGETRRTGRPWMWLRDIFLGRNARPR
ncbi:uncharacterized protein F5891DRAFT_1173836 [Suillus fuscotomentosus]|uniref:Uncharacterized protein n=1 Tax=Suillus fuscotomentosus TaxID=1912939 RepID=A0AAD4E3V8_9AGAM|nr:uncharacterized protein F5891DRAFT_1173836 [Suillus fuscotomentosus]KAG1899243.1 hypothetical protein F5891DRAFT_1173836 [Suillus fuscotomentosus]